MVIGKSFKEGMQVVNTYCNQISNYIISQAEEGYLSLIEPKELTADTDTIMFKMGQNKFILQMTLHHYNRPTIIFKTYQLPRHPQTVIKYIPEMDIVGVAIFSNRGILNFKEEKEYRDDFTNTVDREKSVRDLNSNYFYFLDQHLLSQGV